MDSFQRKALLLWIIISSLGSVLIFSFSFFLIFVHLGTGAYSPERHLLGRLNDLGIRNSDDGCTGVMKVKNDIWMVTKQEDNVLYNDSFSDKKDLTQLEKIVYGKDYSIKKRPNLTFGTPEVSIISKLGTNNLFIPIASVNGDACLSSSNDGSSIFISTDLDFPSTPEYEHLDLLSDVMFRSDDNGNTWFIPKFRRENVNKFLPLKHFGLFIDNKKNVWTVNSENGNIYFSNREPWDISEVIDTTSMQVDINYIIDLLPHQKQTGYFEKGYSGRFIKLDDNNIIVLLSQEFNIGMGEMGAKTVNVITQQRLHRDKGKWQLTGDISYYNNTRIESIAYQKGGAVMALRQNGQIKMATLNNITKKIVVSGSIPDAFYPLHSHGSIRHLEASDNLIVINVANNYTLPKFIFSGRTMSSDNVYASVDSGKTWKKLSIPGYGALLGVFDNYIAWAAPFDWSVYTFKITKTL